jgi:hypothetical protein
LVGIATRRPAENTGTVTCDFQLIRSQVAADLSSQYSPNFHFVLFHLALLTIVKFPMQKSQTIQASVAPTLKSLPLAYTPGVV